MSDEDNKAAEAKKLRSRAAKQAQSAVKNTGRAARVAASIAAEEAGDIVEEVNDSLDNVADTVTENVIKPGISFIPSPKAKIALGYIVGFSAIVYANREALKFYLDKRASQ